MMISFEVRAALALLFVRAGLPHIREEENGMMFFSDSGQYVAIRYVDGILGFSVDANPYCERFLAERAGAAVAVVKAFETK